MKALRRAFALCALTALAAFTQTQTEFNVSGTWQIEYHDKDGQEIDTPMVSFVQTGGHLQGVFGDKHWKVAGTVNGDRVEFLFHPPVRPDITVRYQGKLESGSRMSGTMASEVQSGTFVATRK
jgi:hypothetical protein